MLPKLYSTVRTSDGVGLVLEVGAGHFIVRVYDVADRIYYACDKWEYE